MELNQKALYILFFCKIAWASSRNYYYCTTENGGNSIQSALEKAAIQNGATIKTKTEVVRIVIKNGKASGVICKDGICFDAENIVSGIDANQTYFKLIGEEYLKKKIYL